MLLLVYMRYFYIQKMVCCLVLGLFTLMTLVCTMFLMTGSSHNTVIYDKDGATISVCAKEMEVSLL
jgi:uncharacterized membrane protein